MLQKKKGDEFELALGILYVTGTSSRPLLRQVTSSHTPIWRDDQFHARDDQKCDNDLKKDIHSGWSSSYKNADICLFDVFKNTCVLMVIVVARFFPITAVVITRNQAQTAQLHYR